MSETNAPQKPMIASPAWLGKQVARLEQPLQAIFAAEGAPRWLDWGWLAGLYLAGAFLWAKFLNWGRIPFDFHDWAEVWAPRIHIFRDALLKGVFPFHMSDDSALRGITDRLYALPDIMVSPQMFLLRFMEVGPFFLVNILLLYSLGALGLLWLRRRFSLSLVSFSVLFLLFNFNGHLLAHLSIGHASWSGSLLLPWFFVLLFQLLDGDRTWAWVTKMSLLLFTIYLQGAFHQYVWGMMFLGLLGITSWQYLAQALKALFGAGLLGMVRMLPALLHYSEFDNEFLGGYRSLWDMLEASVKLVPPEQSLDIRSMLSQLAWFELDLYIGLAGLVFLLYFGVARWMKQMHSGGAPAYFDALFLPVLVLALLSIGRIYRVARLVPIPLLSGERVSSRMIILPFLALVIIGAVELQKYFDASPRRVGLRLGGLGFLLVLAHDLWQHLKLWQVNNAAEAFPLTPRDLSLVTVANHPDAPYFTLLGIGAAVTLLALLALLWMTWREKKLKS